MTKIISLQGVAILLAFIFIETTRCYCQEPSHYVRLKCEGVIPDEFRTLTAQKVIQAQEAEKQLKRQKSTQQRVDEFLLWNNYMIDELLGSGLILFGDPVTDYINLVATKLLHNKPELQKKLRFYTVKSSDVNAFSTNQGIIFITIGLMAHLQTEDELAFVLAHEIAHYEKQHTINAVLEEDRLFNESADQKYGNSSNRLRLLSTFSKDLELVADSLGFIRFTNSGYNPQAAISAMEVLKRSFLPFQESEFDPSFLNFNSFSLPQRFWTKEPLEEVQLSEADDDEYSTHPNIKKRKEALYRLQSSTESSSQNSIEDSQFSGIQNIARKELIRLELSSESFVYALYNASGMLKYSPHDPFIEESIGKALYGLCKYTLCPQINQADFLKSPVAGNVRSCYSFIDHLNNLTINKLSIRYLFEMERNYKNSFISTLLDDLLSDAFSNKSLSREILENDLKDILNYKPINSEGFSDLESDSTQINADHAFYLIGLTNDEISDIAQRGENLIQKRQKEAELTVEASENEAKIKRKNERKGRALGINRLIFVDPFFYEFDSRVGLKLMNSELQLIDFKNQITKCAERCDLGFDVLLPKTMEKSEVEKYNDMALLNEWMSENVNYRINKINMIPLQTEYTRELTKKYETDYFCYSGVFSYKKKRENAWRIVAASVLLYPLLPITIASALTPIRQTEYYFLLYDVNTGKEIWVERTTLNRSSGNGYINSIMYDTIYQVSKPIKE